MFGKYDEQGKLVAAPMDLVRLAIPRRVYTQSHIDYVVEVFEAALKERDAAKGFGSAMSRNSCVILRRTSSDFDFRNVN